MLSVMLHAAKPDVLLCGNGLYEMSTGPHAPAGISPPDVSSKLRRQKQADYLPLSPDGMILPAPKEPYLALQGAGLPWGHVRPWSSSCAG